MRNSIAALLLAAAVPSLGASSLIRFEAPQTLGFDDLVALAAAYPAPADVETRLTALLSKPFLSNEAALDGAHPLTPRDGGAKVLRLAEWNINREYNPSILLALSDWSGYQELIRGNPKLRGKRLREALEEARELESADVIVLNEVDHGVKRTGYHDVARDIATRLHMNYIFATEFVELTPLYLGLQKMDSTDLARQERDAEKYGVDPRRYLGLEGSALLSRYPILSARVVRLPDAYDWYHGEIGAISDFRRAEKWTAEKVFEERLKRQVRRGGRLMIVAELAVPGSGKDGVLTVVCPHLEDYSQAKGRRKQMDFVLSQIGPISTPVIVAGDLNTMGHNGAPATVRREIKAYLLNYRFWLREAMYNILPVPGINYAVGVVNYFKNFHDPTAINVPVVASNKERDLFEDVRDFRFEDEGRFDWSANRHASFRHKGRTLSVTNERTWKGFTPTFQFARTYHGLLGVYKLDWIFVKEPAPFSPSGGRTLSRLNYGPPERISDHAPILVDLRLP